MGNAIILREYLIHRLIFKHKQQWLDGTMQNVTVEDNPDGPGDGKIVAGTINWDGIAHSGEHKRVCSPGSICGGIGATYEDAFNNREDKELIWAGGISNLGWSMGPGWEEEDLTCPNGRRYWWNFAVSQEYRSDFINIGSYNAIRISSLSHYFNIGDHEGYEDNVPSLTGTIKFYDSAFQELGNFSFTVPFNQDFTPLPKDTPTNTVYFRVFAELSPSADAYNLDKCCDARFIGGAVPWCNPVQYSFLWGTANGTINPAVQGTNNLAFWTYTHNYGVEMNTGSLVSRGEGATAEWLDNKTLKITVLFNSTGEERRRLRFDVKEKRKWG